MEPAVQQVFDLQDLGVVGDGLDHAELRPGLQLELEDRQRLLVLRVHPLRRDADLVGQALEAHVVMVLLHRDAAGQPLRVRRGRQLDRGLVEHLRAVQLVDRVADHDLLHGSLVLLRLLRELGDGFDFEGRCLGSSRCSSRAQRRGSVLKASRSVARSTNCSRSWMRWPHPGPPGCSSGERRRHDARDRARLREQEQLAPTHTEHLPGDIAGRRRTDTRPGAPRSRREPPGRAPCRRPARRSRAGSTRSRAWPRTGATALQLTFERAMSIATTRVRPTSPALADAYAACAEVAVQPGGGNHVDDAPRRAAVFAASRMTGVAAASTAKAAVRLVVDDALPVRSLEVLKMNPSRRIAALLTTMSSAP